MNESNTTIVVARFNENTDFLKNTQFKTIIYEKDNPASKYNVEKNKGHEATAYLKYILEHYDQLDDYTIFLHCHEFSWHHIGSIIDRINENKNIHHTFTNLNSFILGDMEDLDVANTDIGLYYRSYISPAVGPNKLYPNFTKGNLGCAQFIVHKNNILNHSKLFYHNIYCWLMNTNVPNYWTSRFLEWTWDLFWNKCLQNVAIRKYLNETIMEIQLKDENNAEQNAIKKTEILDLLQTHGYYYVANELTIITNCATYVCQNNYIYNKFV